MIIKVSECINLEHVFGNSTDEVSACSRKFGLYLSLTLGSVAQLFFISQQELM
jgi:hypothetical protein